MENTSKIAEKMTDEVVAEANSTTDEPVEELDVVADHLYDADSETDNEEKGLESGLPVAEKVMEEVVADASSITSEAVEEEVVVADHLYDVDSESDHQEQDIEAALPVAEQQVRVECRICQEDDFIDKMETPCNCSGTLKFAHRDCIQKWVNEKLAMTCEICNHAYEPDYTMVVPPPQPNVQREDVAIAIRDGYFIMRSDRALPEAAAQRAAQIEIAAELIRRRQQAYDNMNRAANFTFSGSRLCRYAAIICVAFLVVKDVYYFIEYGQQRELLTILCVMLGFFVPCYIVAWFAHWWKERNNGESTAPSEVSVVPPSSTGR